MTLGHFSKTDSRVHEGKLKSLEGWTKLPTEELVLPQNYIKAAELVKENPNR